MGDYQADSFRTYGEPFSISNFFNGDSQEKIASGVLVVQYSTGMNDKNGKEIFEGDIVTYNKRGGIMADCNNYADIIMLKGKPKMVYFSKEQWPINGWNFLYDTFEVVGNIYDNPAD
jgi:uncharacterized phage protein (TIGR01671 family)